MLNLLRTFGAWLRAIPGPTDQWAAILSAWAWPVAVLVIAWWIRVPLGNAASALAERFGTDELNLWGLSVSKGDRKIPLDSQEAREESASYTAEDVEIIERLYEFAGESAENAGRLTDWVVRNVDAELHPIDFLSEPVFAPDRQTAYKELVGAEH